jgi:putative oxidoreductase
VPCSGVLAIAGGLSVLFGFHARWGAACLLAFLVPVTLSMHAFWGIDDPVAFAVQRAHFMKNVSLIGSALLIVYFGAGPLAFDR